MQLSPELLGLIRKYDRAGPRYTSYPPANHFKPVAEHALATDIMGPVPDDDRPLSLYLHIPFCETLCWFCGCHTITSLNRDRADDYLQTLEREMQLHHARFGKPRRVVQVHFGGGTPNFLSPGQILRLGEALHRCFAIEADAEVSVELDPRRLSREHVEAFRQIGVNRASFGVQDCNPDVQKAIHRVQPSLENRSAMTHLREAGISSVNIDLIYGLPLQSTTTFAATLEEVLALQPDRFAVFNYAHVPWMKPAQKILERHPRPSPEQKLQLLKLVIETLTGAGFHYIGMDHFARPADELVQAQRQGVLQRNFQGYSTRGGVDILGLGLSSISQTANRYWQHAKELPAYREAIAQGRFALSRHYTLSNEDACRRGVIMQLMCNLGLQFADFPGPEGQPFAEYFAETLSQLREMEHDGLLEIQDDALRVTPNGALFLRNLAMAFDTYLASAPNRYSRTV